MSRLVLLFRSKVALAIMGAVLCGGGAAWMVATPFNFSSGHSSNAQFQTQAGAVDITGDTATPGATAPTTPSAAAPGSKPSATSTPKSTRSPTPTATPGSQGITLRGSVGSVNTNAGTFTLISNGVTKTVVVTNNTTYHNGLSSLSDLHSGLYVAVRGTYQPDGTFAATSVSQADD